MLMDALIMQVIEIMTKAYSFRNFKFYSLDSTICLALLFKTASPSLRAVYISLLFSVS